MRPVETRIETPCSVFQKRKPFPREETIHWHKHRGYNKKKYYKRHTTPNIFKNTYLKRHRGTMHDRTYHVKIKLYNE